MEMFILWNIAEYLSVKRKGKKKYPLLLYKMEFTYVFTDDVGNL